MAEAMIKHKYISTYCLHDLHEECRRKCKHCDARCLCWCHEHQATEEAASGETAPDHA